MGGVVAGQDCGASRYLFAGTAGSLKDGTWPHRLFADPLQRLSCAGANSKKKTLIASEQDRPDVVKQRVEWRAVQPTIDPNRYVFIDETWAKTNMTRRYGRSQLGVRLLEKTPCGRWETTTFLGALRATGFVAPLTVEG